MQTLHVYFIKCTINENRNCKLKILKDSFLRDCLSHNCIHKLHMANFAIKQLFMMKFVITNLTTTSEEARNW